MSRFCEPVAIRTDYETPTCIFGPLNDEFKFHTDVCANSHNAKCQHYFAPRQDGLKQHWSGMCWMNPPYGKSIGEWIEKAYDSACSGDATVVCLLPVRSNCEWWKFCIAGEIRFIRKKIKFVGAPSVSMFPNAIVIFHAYLDPGNITSIWRPL